MAMNPGPDTRAPGAPAPGRTERSRTAGWSARPGAALPAATLVSAIRKLLRPLVRLLLANQITFPFLSGLLKEVYVEAADDDFALEGKRQTTSRVSLLTGIHRKDVKRLLEERSAAGAGGDAVPKGVSLGALLVSTWTAAPEYLDDSGHPLPLPRLASEPNEPSFESLVASVSKDIHSRAVLDEWLRLGVVELDDREQIHLVVDAFVPDRGFDEKAYYLGENVHDHIAAAAHNLAGGKPAQLERRVHYDALSPESVRELAELADDLGMQALQAVNRRARELKKRDTRNDSGRERMSFGIYFHSADSEVPEPAAAPDEESEPRG